MDLGVGGKVGVAGDKTQKKKKTGRVPRGEEADADEMSVRASNGVGQGSRRQSCQIDTFVYRFAVDYCENTTPVKRQ